MELVISQSALAKAVGLAGGAASTKSTLPILSNLLLVAEKDQLTVTGTDLASALAVAVPTRIVESGSITLPAKMLSAIVNAVPPLADIRIVTGERTMTATLTYGQARASIKGIDPVEYPLIPTVDGEPTMTLSGADLSTLIRRTAFAASDARDTSRPALTSVVFGGKDGYLVCAATDGYRLAVAENKALDAGSGALVPGEALRLVDRLAQDATTVAVHYTDNQAHFTFTGGEKAGWETATLTAQLVNAKFPDFIAIVPKTVATTVVVDTAELTRTLKTASLYARDNSDRVRLTVSPAKDETPAGLRVKTESVETGDFAQDLPAEVTGPELEAAFNVAYLLDGLAVLGQPQARIEFTKADRPCKLVGDEYMYVVMPMQIGKV